MTDQELKDLVASLAVSQAATSKAQDRNDTLFADNAVQFAATASQVAETSRKFDAMGIRLGKMGQNKGAVAVEFFYNSPQAKPILGGVHDDDVFHSIRSFSGKLQGLMVLKRAGDVMEVDAGTPHRF